MKHPSLALSVTAASGHLANAGGLIAGAGTLLLLWLTDRTAFLPLRARYFLVAGPSVLACLLFSAKRRAVRGNLRLILGREPSRGEILRVFLEYGRYFAECADLAGFWKENEKNVVYSSDLSKIEPAFLGLTFHLGNFEIFGFALHGALKTDYSVVAERLKPKFLADYFAAKRRRYNMNTIPHDDPRGILRVLESGSPIGMVCDRLIGGRGVPTRLFGKPVRLPLSIVGIALRRRIPIYVAYSARENGNVTISIERLDPALPFETIVQTIARILETALRKYPYQWHVLSKL